MEKTIVFICEFGPKIGWGHLVRCSAIAEEANARSWHTVLLSKSEAKNGPADSIAAFKEHRLGESNYQAPGKADFICIDIPTLTDANIEITKSNGAKALVLDDLQKRTLASADIVLNNELGLGKALYKPIHKSLLGETYSLIRIGFQNPSPVSLSLQKNQIPVLITLGGTDPFRVTLPVLKYLKNYDSQSFHPIVVLEKTSLDVLEIAQTLSSFPSHTWLEKQSASEMAAWIQHSQFGICGCGGTIYEFAAMGTPFIGLSLVDNQKKMARSIQEKWKFPIHDVEAKHLKREEFVTSLETILKMKKNRSNYSGIDLQGPSRILEELERISIISRTHP